MVTEQHVSSARAGTRVPSFAIDAPCQYDGVSHAWSGVADADA